MTVTMIDPPEGWRYGFPKVIPDGVTDATAWLIEQGYPKEVIASYGVHFFCRYWKEDNKEDKPNE